MSNVKQLFRLSLLAAGISLAAHGHAQESKQVNFYNWSDYIAEDTLPGFTEKTGINVTYDVYDSNEVLEAKLLAGNTGFDIVVPTNVYLLRQIKAGVFQELDKSKIPNYSNLDPELMKLLEANDPENKYGIPYMGGTTGIGYNVDKVKAIFGDDAPLDSWDLVLDPENLKKLSACGVAFLDSPTDIFPTVLNYLKLDPSSTKPGDYTGAATEHLLKLRPHITYFHSSKFITDLANGDVCAVVAWSGDILQARDRAIEANNGVNIDYFIPKEGALLWYDILVIPRDAKNVDNAHALLNYLLEPEVMAGISNYVSYANPVPASLEFIDEDIRNNKGIFPEEEIANKLFVVHDLPAEVHRAMTRAWTRVRTGR